GNKNDINQHGYTCQYDSDSSSMVMDFDKESIFSKLLYDIEFRLYLISLADKLSIMIFSLSASKKEVEVWNNNIKILQYEGNSLANVWQKVRILGKYQDMQLFGFEHTYTQSELQRLYISKYQLSQ
ncbi:17919_t:CDS:2, partial [Funneliformis caledonium]